MLCDSDRWQIFADWMRLFEIGISDKNPRRAEPDQVAKLGTLFERASQVSKEEAQLGRAFKIVSIKALLVGNL